MKIILLFTILFIASCKKPNNIVLTHYCKDGIITNSVYYHVTDETYCFKRCDMCNTIIEINKGTLINHREVYHEPINNDFK